MKKIYRLDFENLGYLSDTLIAAEHRNDLYYFLCYLRVVHMKMTTHQNSDYENGYANYTSKNHMLLTDTLIDIINAADQLCLQVNSI